MRKFTEGDIVEIIDGPYRGEVGKIIEVIEFDPGVVGLYLIKTKDGKIIKVIDSAILRPVEENELEPEEEKEDTITITRDELREAIVKVCMSRELADNFSDPLCTMLVSMSGIAIGTMVEKELFDD